MLLAILRWLGRNLGTLLLAFILAIVVWVSSVTAADPNEVNTYRPVPLDKVSQDSGLKMVGNIPEQVRVTLRAPRTIWTRMNSNPEALRAWIDLSELGPGEHTVFVLVTVDPSLSLVRIIQVDPSTVHFTLEPLVSQKMPVQLLINGDTPVGYKTGDPLINPDEVTISGAESAVIQVSAARAILDITNTRETKRIAVPVEAVDENGAPVPDVTVNPKTITVTQPVFLEGGYKNVAVKVVTEGQVANGYRLTNVSVTPPNVTLFSSNPQLVNDIPGFVETRPVDLTGLSDDVEVRMELNLPSEITLVGEQSVLVQVGIAAIEGSLTVSLPVEKLGLPPELEALVSPPTIDVIVTGPLPVLDNLTPASFRAVVDLTGQVDGPFQIEPIVDLIPDQVQIQSKNPELVEVNIVPAPTPTATSATPSTPLPVIRLTVTPTSTVQP